MTDQPDAVYADPATGVVRLHRRTPDATQERLAAELVRAFAENAALTDALAALAHEFEDVCEFSGCGLMVASDDEAETYCAQPPDAPVHRTPAVVRAELDALDVLQPPDAATLGRLRDGLNAIGDRT